MCLARGLARGLGLRTCNASHADDVCALHVPHLHPQNSDPEPCTFLCRKRNDCSEKPPLTSCEVRGRGGGRAGEGGPQGAWREWGQVAYGQPPLGYGVDCRLNKAVFPVYRCGPRGGVGCVCGSAGVAGELRSGFGSVGALSPEPSADPWKRIGLGVCHQGLCWLGLARRGGNTQQQQQHHHNHHHDILIIISASSPS